MRKCGASHLRSLAFNVNVSIRTDRAVYGNPGPDYDYEYDKIKIL